MFTLSLDIIRQKERKPPKHPQSRHSSVWMQWSPDSRLLASGGNDNVVNIWDVRGTKQPEWVINEHNAAVKALSWSPHNTGQLASAGGLRDGTIR